MEKYKTKNISEQMRSKLFSFAKVENKLFFQNIFHAHNRKQMVVHIWSRVTTIPQHMVLIYHMVPNSYMVPWIPNDTIPHQSTDRSHDTMPYGITVADHIVAHPGIPHSTVIRQ